MDEAEAHPAGDERCLPFHDTFEKGEGGITGIDALGIMAAEGVIDEDAQAFEVATGRKIFARADAQMRGRDAGEDAAGLDLLAIDLVAAPHGGEGAGGGDAEGVHRFGDEIFAQDGAESGAAVAAPGKGGGAGPLQLDVAMPPVAMNDFAEKDGPPIAEDGGKPAELMAGVGGGERLGPFRNPVA